MSRYQPQTNTLCSVGHRSAGFVVSSAEVDPIPALFVKATGGRNRRINLCSGDARIMQSHGPSATAQDSTFMIFRGFSTGLRRTIRCGGVFGGTEEDGGNVRMPHYPGRVRGMSIRVKLRHNIFHDFSAPFFSDTYRAGKSGHPLRSRRGFAVSFTGDINYLHTGCVSIIIGSSALLHERTVVTREDETCAPFPELDCPAATKRTRHTSHVIQSLSLMESLPSPNACVQGLYAQYFERIIEQMRRFKSIDLSEHELPIRYIFRSEMDVTDFYAEEYFLDRVIYIDDNSFAIEVTGMTDNPDNYTPETIEAARIERAPGTEKRFVVSRENVAEPPYIYLLGFYLLMRVLERTAELYDCKRVVADMQPIYDDDSEFEHLMSDLDRIGQEILGKNRFSNLDISNSPS